MHLQNGRQFMQATTALKAQERLVAIRGVVRRGRGGRRPPLFFDRGTRPPLSPLLWTEIRAKVSPLLQLATY